MWSFLLLTTVVAQATARRPLWFPTLPYRVKHKQIEMPKTMEDKVTVLKDDIVRELTEVPDVDLEKIYTCSRAEARLEAAGVKIHELEEKLKVVLNSLKSFQNSEDQASQREDIYEETIRDLTQRLKEAEFRAAEAESSVSRLQKEVIRLEDELLA